MATTKSTATKATKATKAATKPAAKPATAECKGVPQLGIKPHRAKANTDTFTAKAANANGLSKRCKACQAADRKARRARKATTSPVAAPQQAEAAGAVPTPAATKAAPEKAAKA